MTSNIDQEKATLATEKEPPKTLAAQKEQQQEEDQEDIPLPVKFGYKKGLCLHLSLSTEAHENCALRGESFPLLSLILHLTRTCAYSI